MALINIVVAPWREPTRGYVYEGEMERERIVRG
jgi:hypothetical protein